MFNRVLCFGEVLFDCLPGGEETLGGAPFNVAWNLNAFQCNSALITRVGDDDRGVCLLDAMRCWGMPTSQIQIDACHPTGKVLVTFEDSEPAYEIAQDAAWDFIEPPLATELGPADQTILYHGTLAMRNQTNQKSLNSLRSLDGISRFVDVNLRAPWWQRNQVVSWLAGAKWVKLNEEELQLLHSDPSGPNALADFQASHSIGTVILTLGSRGAVVRDASGREWTTPSIRNDSVVDTVGAGDAFSSAYLFGLLNNHSTADILAHASAFASRIVGIKGATTSDRDFYV